MGGKTGLAGVAAVALIICVGIETAGAQSALVDAIKANDVTTVRTLLDKKVDVNAVHADGTTYPFIGGAVSGGQRLQVRVEAGKWLSDGLSDTTWGVRVIAPVGLQATLWAGVRQDAPDPLYWNAARRSWNVGVTRQIGRASRSRLSEPVRAGTVVIRVPVSDAPGASLSIAGDFTKWQPVLMRREGAIVTPQTFVDVVKAVDRYYKVQMPKRRRRRVPE